MSPLGFKARIGYYSAVLCFFHTLSLVTSLSRFYQGHASRRGIHAESTIHHYFSRQSTISANKLT